MSKMFGMVVQQLLVPYRTNVKGASEFTTKDCGNPVRYQAIVVKVAFRVDPSRLRLQRDKSSTPGECSALSSKLVLPFGVGIAKAMAARERARMVLMNVIPVAFTIGSVGSRFFKECGNTGPPG